MYSRYQCSADPGYIPPLTFSQKNMANALLYCIYWIWLALEDRGGAKSYDKKPGILLFTRSILYPLVLRIHDILVWIHIRIHGSIPLTNGSGSDADRNPSIFTFDLQDAYIILLLEGTFTSFFKD
jgi:hypothetical protein